MSAHVPHVNAALDPLLGRGVFLEVRWGKRLAGRVTGGSRPTPASLTPCGSTWQHLPRSCCGSQQTHSALAASVGLCW